MKPRLFCRESSYPRVLALTYSFDPLFFERIILRDLGVGGSADITVVGDRNELQNAVTRYAGQMNHLGKTYLLSPAETKGAFHPKLLLRIGNKGARLLLGSGNLTYGGWGGNRELAYQLNLDATQIDSATIVNHILDHTVPYLSSEVGKNAIDRLRDYSWLSVANNAPSNILMTTPDAPLSSQLLRRWAGRRFQRMVVFTGSTDEHGAFIRWCHDRFGVEECVVAISPENSSFVKDDIERCPVKVSLAPFVGREMLHAKFFWFDGPDGAAAIVGSANCSGAAWLRSPIEGGNVEIVQVYDSADANDFAAILSALPTDRVAVVRPRPTETSKDEKISPEFFIKAIHLHRGQGFLDVILNQPLPANAVARLLGPSDIEIPLMPVSNDLLSGQSSEAIVWPETTCLAKILIASGDIGIETPMHWVDDMDAIIRASQSKPPAEPFKNLSRSNTSSEHDKVVSDLAIISASIFSDSAAYRDPPQRRNTDRHNQNDNSTEPVKPEDLVKSLNDLKLNKADIARDLGGGMYLSMNGVMRALFEEVELLASSEDEAATGNTDTPEGGDEPPRQKDKEKLSPGATQRELPINRHRQRLKDELGRFFEKFSSLEFANECTVSKLVQAAAFPLAISLLGERGGWLMPVESRDYVTRVVDILLNRNRVGCREKGLLEEVRNRYRTRGQEDIFLQVIGDGTLWVGLLAVMAQMSWTEDFQKFERAINLHRVYECEAMRSDTSVGKLTTLVTRLDVERAHELIASEAPRIAMAINSIEKILGQNRDNLLTDQASQNHRDGDLIWNPNTGWGIVKNVNGAMSSMDAYLHLRGEISPVMKKNFFVNLRMAAEQSEELRHYLLETGVSL